MALEESSHELVASICRITVQVGLIGPTMESRCYLDTPREDRIKGDGNTMLESLLISDVFSAGACYIHL